MASPAVSRKGRKQNFSASRIAVLTEKVEENLSIIQSKLTNSVTNLKRNEAWQKIADAVNAVGISNRTAAEIREKWKKNHIRKRRRSSQCYQRSRKTLVVGQVQRCCRLQRLRLSTCSKIHLPLSASTVLSRKVRIFLYH